MIQSLRKRFPDISIDIVVRKGNEGLLSGFSNIDKIHVWDKKKGKYRNLRNLGKELRQKEYDVVYNLQRFFSSGYLTWKAAGKIKVGYRKNPFSRFFTHRIDHKIGNGRHEVERNHELLRSTGDFTAERPALFPTASDNHKAAELAGSDPYYVMAPSSVWFTKQMPEEKWLELMKVLPAEIPVLLIGGPADKEKLDELIQVSGRSNAVNTAGALTLIQSAALIGKAKRTYVNDSAPLHMASAMNAPVTAFFCSTIPDFGFGPLSDDSQLLESVTQLDCRPCGLHGHRTCPKSHFKCGTEIDVTLCSK